MRAAFASTLAELARQDPRILLLTGDLGYTVLEPFAEEFPGRFFNVGVAEQNMVGLATGLAESGFMPFLYSIATFASLRPYEVIRHGPVLHQFPVRIVAVGGGFEYGTAGASHHALEDVAIMRAQPGLTVVAPADGQQARGALLATWNLPGPVYYRLGKDEKTLVPGLNGRFEVGRAQLVRDGSRLLLIGLGPVAAEAVKAAEVLEAQGVSCAVLVVASVSPAPVADLAAALSRFRAALTIEEHYVPGGLGSLVSEVVAENGLPCRVVRCGVRALAHGVSGSQAYLRREHGLSAEKLVQTALQLVKDTAKG